MTKRQRSALNTAHRAVWGVLVAFAVFLALAIADAYGSAVRVENGVLIYESTPGVQNTVSTVGPACYDVVQGPCPAFYFLIDEDGAPYLGSRPPGETIDTIGPGCSRTAGGAQGSLYQAFCLAGAITSLDVDLRDQDDWFDGAQVDVPMTLKGGDGHDELRDGARDDLIFSGAGDDTVSAKAGNDQVLGEAGNDQYYGLFCTRPEPPAGSTEPPGAITCDSGTDSAKDSGNDLFIGGDGTDTADFRDVSLEASLSADGDANDGKAGEADNIAPDVENIFGGPANDTLVGNEKSNILDGGRGNDTLDGSSAGDTLRGGSGADTVSYTDRSAGVSVNLGDSGGDGEPSEDDRLDGIENVLGGRGPDTLVGSGLENSLTGGRGEDFLDGRGGRDQAEGGDATDLIRIRDGISDRRTSCGSGRDFVIADPGESAPPDCETVDNRLADRPVAGRKIALAPRGPFALGLPRAQRLFELTDHVNIPVGSKIDSRRAKVQLTAVKKPSRKKKRRRGRRRTTQPSGIFDGGIFRVRQRSPRSPIDLVLKGDELDSCPAATAANNARVLRGRRRINAITVRRGYRIRGRWSSGIAYGTTWTVADYCDGTRTTVETGTVKVRDVNTNDKVIVSNEPLPEVACDLTKPEPCETPPPPDPDARFVGSEHFVAAPGR